MLRTTFPGGPAYDIALQIKAYIEQYTEPSPSIAPGAQISVADEISKLKRLLDDGVLTQAEFDGKKKQLLGL